MVLILWEKWSRGHIKGGWEELPETPIEKGPHTGLKGISGKVTRGSNPTSAYSYSVPIPKG